MDNGITVGIMDKNFPKLNIKPQIQNTLQDSQDTYNRTWAHCCITLETEGENLKSILNQ